jgi:hypothetical protein
MTTMMRISHETRQRVMKIAAEDFGGITADETVVRLLDVYWQAKCVAAVEHFHQHDPDGWADYIGDAEGWDMASAPVTEPWEVQPSDQGARTPPGDGRA